MKRPRIGLSPELIVFDFDGVLTDNQVLVFSDGTEAVRCSRSDGMAFDLFKKQKIRCLILSTEQNPVVRARAQKLGIPVLFGISDKLTTLREYCKKNKLTLSKVMYVGNDLNDYRAMCQVGYPICPADAHREVQKICIKRLKTRGGQGVAREIAERILNLNYLSN